MLSSFSQLYKFFLRLLMFIWTLFIAFLFFKVTAWMSSESNLVIPNSIIGLLIGVLSSTYLYTILLIPYELSIKFDAIKNKVAHATYTSVEAFQADIAQFIAEMFKYPGARITGGIYKFKNSPTLCINVPTGKVEAETLEALAKNTSVKSINLLKKKAFFVPIQMDGHALGYMVLFTQGFTFPLFKTFLSDFENHYLDDQLMHVINQTQQKQNR